MESRFERQMKKGVLEMLVLGLLCQRPAHGYQLLNEIASRSGGFLQLKEGTLYPILRELESQGAVSCYEQEVSGRVRKYYHLTRKGKRLLAEEREQWERYARAINTVLELS